MHTIPPSPRPLPALAIAAFVLVAHALLLGWLMRSPSSLVSRPEQRLTWVSLHPAQTSPTPPRPSAPPQPAAAAAATHQPAQPSRRRPTITKPAPRAPAPWPEPPRPQPAIPAAPAAPRPAASPEMAAPSAQPEPSAPKVTAQPAAHGPAAEPRTAPAASASAPPAAAPAVETAASYKADYLDNPPPPYPRLSRQLGEEGTVLLKVQVGADGRALQVRLLSSSGFARLDEAAETTVAQWRFVAATRNGQAITSWVLVPIKFKILN